MPFPIEVSAPISVGEKVHKKIHLYSGITVIIGPNGSGKTQLLRSLKGALSSQVGNKRVRYLSAGRAWHLEQYRSDYDGHRGNTPRYDEARFGSLDDTNRRHNYETLQGDFQTLALRADIQVKVRERLRKLFGRDLIVQWDAGQLKIAFVRTNGNGKEYSSAREASGLLHLAGLLAAIYDDEVGALLIDEPEVSLHPQLQAFLLKELSQVAGEPDSATNKKLILLATHSTEFVRVDAPEQLSNLIFCYDPNEPPVQVSPDAGELKSKKVFGLIARMGQEHKLCFFARTPLLVEGPSDGIICNALSNRLEISLEAGGSQLLPVIGKGQFGVVNKLFRLLGKAPLVLADADALADGLDLVNDFLQGPDAESHAARMGFGTGTDVSRSVYGAFCELVDKRWAEIAPLAEAHPYWTNRTTEDGELKAKRRAALSALFVANDSALAGLSTDNAWVTIRKRIEALLELTERQGLYILRRGTIESYYAFVTASEVEKPSLAAEEAAAIRSAEPSRIEGAYSDVLRFLRKAASTDAISEVEALQDMLLAIAAPALARVKAGASQDALRSLMLGILGKQSDLFGLEIVDGKLRMSLNSKILNVTGFPITLSTEEDVLRSVANALGLRGSPQAS